MKIQDQYGSPDERYSYRSPLIDALRQNGREQKSGRITIRLAEKLGFCWGVDRAVAMVWDALRRNPGRRLWLLNQIIHNPKVNEDFQKNGVRFVFGRYAEPGGFDRVQREDLVIIPAFSAEVEHLQRMKQIGCEVVDTTCPWVEKPHRRVLKYIEDGFTTLIHGQPGHDETRATCSLVDSKGGRWIVLRNLDDADALGSFLRGDRTPDEFKLRFSGAWSAGFEPVRDLERVGMVNQTTMLASESREVAQRVAAAIAARDQLRAAITPSAISCATSPSSSNSPKSASAASPTARAAITPSAISCATSPSSSDSPKSASAASPTAPAAITPSAISCATSPSSSDSPKSASAASPTAVAHFRDFDTICPATQDNQDAVIELTQAATPDLFIVLGGYDSSNTANLLRAARARRGTYHVQDPASITAEAIRHRDPQSGREVATRDWLPDGALVIGVSAGASTPDTELAEVIRRICAAAGAPLSADEAVARP